MAATNADPDSTGLPQGAIEMDTGSNYSAPAAHCTSPDYSSNEESNASTTYDSGWDSEFDGCKTYDEIQEMEAKQQDEAGLEDQLKELEDMLDEEEYAELWDEREFFFWCPLC